MDWQNFLLGVLTSATVTTALTAVLAFLCRAWIIERLKASIKYEYDEKLEQMKAELRSQGDRNLAELHSEIDRQAEKMRIAAASFSDVQKATISRKLEAVDHLWNAARRARTSIPGAITLTDVLTDDELADLSKATKFNDLLQMIRAVKTMEILPAFFDDAEVSRPHVGEYVWALYATYHGLLARAVLLICGTKPNSDRRWFRDRNLLRLVESAFGPEKRGEFESLSLQRLNWLQRQFERELFASFDKLLTGKAFGEAALKQAVEMERLVATLQVERDAAVTPSP